MRRAAKVDSNQASIVEDLRLVPGCSVVNLAGVGKGCPDLLIGFRGFNFLVEVKNPETVRGEKPETVKRQKKFRDEWKGQVLRAYTFKEILDYMLGRTEQ